MILLYIILVQQSQHKQNLPPSCAQIFFRNVDKIIYVYISRWNTTYIMIQVLWPHERKIKFNSFWRSFCIFFVVERCYYCCRYTYTYMRHAHFYRHAHDMFVLSRSITWYWPKCGGKVVNGLARDWFRCSWVGRYKRLGTELFCIISFEVSFEHTLQSSCNPHKSIK